MSPIVSLVHYSLAHWIIYHSKEWFFAYQRVFLCIVSLIHFDYSDGNSSKTIELLPNKLLRFIKFIDFRVSASKQHVRYILSPWDSLVSLMGLFLFRPNHKFCGI